MGNSFREGVSVPMAIIILGGLYGCFATAIVGDEIFGDVGTEAKSIGSLLGIATGAYIADHYHHSKIREIR